VPAPPAPPCPPPSTPALDAALGEAVPLEGTRSFVPEPHAKALLRELGITVPSGLTAAEPASDPRVAELEAPLVLKAYGPGIVHKSELGAVHLGLAPGAVAAAAAEMRSRLDAAGLPPAGFLVEEQAEPGVELLVGVVHRPPFGHLAVVGLGGTLTELLDEVAVRLCPLSADEARSMLADFRGAAALDGVRGRPGVDRDALIALLLAIAGDDGLVARLGSRLAELDCNPVIASARGAVVADARLVLEQPREPTAEAAPPADFAKAFAPHSIAVAGASTSKRTFGNRALAAYRDLGWTDGLYALHPRAAEIDGVPAVPTLDAVPGGSGVDYLLAAVPVDACIELVAQEGAHAGIVHVITSGFGEVGPDGTAREDRLLAAARTAGVRVLGPNCIGIYAPEGRQTFQLGVPRAAGRVSVASQSGGLSGDLVRVGARRGLRFSKVASIGNGIDVGPGELVEYLVDDPDTAVIGLYLEATRDGERLVRAFRRARGVKPVTALVGGRSRQGRAAATSHTGALVGDDRLWDALAATTGVTLVRTLEELLATLVLLQDHADSPAPGDPDVLVIGVGGVASVLATDACDRAGLEVARVRDDLVEQLRGLGHGAGTSVVNPLEIGIGPASGPDVVNGVLDVVLPAQPYPDVLVHVNVQAYYGYGTGGVAPLIELIPLLAGSRTHGARLALVARNLDVAPGGDLEAVLTAAADAGLPLMRTLDEAAVAIAAAKRHARNRFRAGG